MCCKRLTGHYVNNTITKCKMVLTVFAQSLSLMMAVSCWVCCINKFYILNDQKEKLNHMVNFWISNSLMLIKVSAILINPLVNCSIHYDVILPRFDNINFDSTCWDFNCLWYPWMRWDSTLAPLARIHQLKLHTGRSKIGTSRMWNNIYCNAI